MLKLGSISKNRSLRIKLPEHWHSKILEFTSSIQFPYNFILESVEKNKDHNEVYYIFHSKKNQKLVLTELGQKVSNPLPRVHCETAFWISLAVTSFKQV